MYQNLKTVPNLNKSSKLFDQKILLFANKIKKLPIYFNIASFTQFSLSKDQNSKRKNNHLTFMPVKHFAFRLPASKMRC